MRAVVLAMVLAGCGRDVYPVAVDPRARAFAPDVDGAIEAWRARGVAFRRDDADEHALRVVVVPAGTFSRVAAIYGDADDHRIAQCGPFNQLQLDPALAGVPDPKCVIEHELGHAHGLEHVGGAGSLMSPAVASGGTCAWSDADAAELRAAEARGWYRYAGGCP